jgi:hypothetical protein
MADEPFGFISDSRMRQLLADMQLIKSIVLGNQNTQQPQLGPAPIYVTNVSGEEIPAYACMQCTGTEVIGNRTYIQVDQPADSTGEAGGFLFNSPRAIAIDANGIGFAGPHVKALGDGSTATSGDKWGPVASAWTVADDADGIFVVIGDDDVATNVVRLFAGVSGGGGNAVHFVSPVGGIPARTSLTMGNGSCDIYECNTSGVLSDSGNNETVYNMASSAIAGSTHGIAMRNDAGLLVAVVEDCG